MPDDCSFPVQSGSQSRVADPVSTTLELLQPPSPSLLSSMKEDTTIAEALSSMGELSDLRPLPPLTLDELGLHPPATPSALLDTVDPIPLPRPSEGDRSEQRTSQILDDRATSQVGTDLLVPQRQSERKPSGFLHKENVKEDRASEPTSAPAVSSCTGEYDSFLALFLQSLSSENSQSPNAGTSATAPPSSAPPSADVCTAITPSVEIQERADGILREGTRLGLQTSLTQKQPRISNLHGSAATKSRSRSNGSVRFSEPSTPLSFGAADESSVLSRATSTGPVKQELSPSAELLRHLLQTAPSTSHYRCPTWSSPSTASSAFPCSAVLLGSHSSASKASSRTTDPSPASCANPPALWTSFLASRSDFPQVTPKPLEGVGSSTVASAKENAPSNATTSTTGSAGHSSQAVTSNPLSSAKWSFDLLKMSQFSLPQAPPLQPEHRYPIQILETDGRYDLDADTDRESEAYHRPEVSPSHSDGNGASPLKKHAAPRGIKRTLDSTRSDVERDLIRLKSPNSCDSGNTRRGSSSAFPSSHPHGATMSKSGLAGDSDGSALKMVPLSNIFRSRSWSNASQSIPASSDSWHTGSGQAKQSRKSVSLGTPGVRSRLAKSTSGDVKTYSGSDATSGKLVSEPVCAKFGSKHGTAAITTMSSSTSDHATRDFTRQALLDLVRRPSLNVASDSRDENSAKRESPSGKICASATQDMCAPPQGLINLVHLEHQRKGQKRSLEPAVVASSGDTSRTCVSQLQSASAHQGEHQARSSKRSGMEQELERKIRKQAQYQRVLTELQEQMRMNMYLDKQKQRELQGKTQPKETSERKSGQIAILDLSAPYTSSRRKDLRQSFASGGDCLQLSSHATVGEVPTTTAIACPPRPVQSTGVGEDPKATEMIVTPTRVGIGDEISSPSNAFFNIDTSFSSGCTTAPNHPPRSWQNDTITRYAYQAATATTQGYWPPTDQYPAFGPVSGGCENPTTGLGLPISSMPDKDHSANADTWTGVRQRHFSWLRDSNAPTLTPIAFAGNVASSSTRQSPLPLVTGSQTAAIGMGQSRSKTSASEPYIKRLFAPGEEVVFWAVKNEFSVKLVGTVESMTEDSASIVVTKQQAGDKTSEQRKEMYRNISFTNIVPMDQAIVLGFA